jgi:hypothetical protein
MASADRAGHQGGKPSSRALRRAGPFRHKVSKDCVSELTGQMQPRPHTYNNYNLPNGAAGGHPNLPPGAAPLLPNNGRIIQTGGVRVLCIADVRGKIVRIYCKDASSLLPGNLRSLNDLAKQARADHIIHTGDFGFYDETSLDRIAEK